MQDFRSVPEKMFVF